MVRLIVKAPNQKIHDQTMEADLSWSVKKLKEFLSEEYPSKPIPSDQRLIYSGHLLKDEQQLEHVFASESVEEQFIIHLVCSQKQTSVTPPTNSPRSQVTSNPTVSSPSTAGPQVPSPTFNPGSMLPGFNPALLNPVMTGFNATVPLGSVPSSPLMPMMMMWTPEQMAAVQQMYTQFVAQYQAANGNLDMPPEQVVRQRNVEQNPAPVIGAQGGAALEDEEEEVDNRDWLAWFYWGSRALVLLSIVYFYSSFTRLAIVFFLVIFIYLYQTGVFNPRNDAVRMVEDEANHEEDMNQVNEGNENNARPHERTSSVPEVVNPVSETERFSGLRLCWVIVSSLFSSLIPDAVPDQLN